MSLRILIVDDEQQSRKNLTYLLTTHFPELSIIGEVASVASAIALLNHQHLDAIFLDINMPGENGFDLLEAFPDRSFAVVFVTAYAQYALRAIKASALDYLLKPVSVEELASSISRIYAFREQQALISNYHQNYRETLKLFRNQLREPESLQKLAIPYEQGIHIINIEDIIQLEAHNNYTIFHLYPNRQLVASRTLKNFEELFDPDRFVRVHKSHIIHLKYLENFTRKDNPTVQMVHGLHIPVSRRRLKQFINSLEQWSKSA